MVCARRCHPSLAMPAATGRSSAIMSLLMLSSLGALMLHIATKLTFVSFTAPAARARLPRHAESGKVNLQEEEDEFQSWKAYSAMKGMDVESSVADAIQTCVDDGCSVEAMMTLDRILAENEERVMSAKSEKSSDEVAVAWLDNFLSKTVSLRSQLLAVKPAMAKSEKSSDEVAVAWP